MHFRIFKYFARKSSDFYGLNAEIYSPREIFESKTNVNDIKEYYVQSHYGNIEYDTINNNSYIDKLPQKPLSSQSTNSNIKIEKPAIIKKQKNYKPIIENKNFTHYIQNWTNIPKYKVLEELHQNILFEDDNIIGINKPYGISTTGDKTNLYSISSLLNDFAKLTKHEKYYIVHRLDKDATGVLLLAKSQMAQSKINECFNRRLITKHYRAIIVGYPDTDTGRIEIPVETKKVNGIYKTYLVPDINQQTHSNFDGQNGNNPFLAKSDYKVIEKVKGASYLDILSKTGYKHQIRAHLSFGLGCPILGDHKYSHLHELKPQKLPQVLLEKLNVRQQKVRNIPLHLHAYSIQLPPFLFHDDNNNMNMNTCDDSMKNNTSFDTRKVCQENTIFIKAGLPKQFKQNLMTLGFRNINKIII